LIAMAVPPPAQTIALPRKLPVAPALPAATTTTTTSDAVDDDDDDFDAPVASALEDSLENFESNLIFYVGELAEVFIFKKAPKLYKRKTIA